MNVKHSSIGDPQPFDFDVAMDKPICGIRIYNVDETEIPVMDNLFQEILWDVDPVGLAWLRKKMIRETEEFLADCLLRPTYEATSPFSPKSETKDSHPCFLAENAPSRICQTCQRNGGKLRKFC